MRVLRVLLSLLLLFTMSVSYGPVMAYAQDDGSTVIGNDDDLSSSESSDEQQTEGDDDVPIVFITEIQVNGDEFIELYNPTDEVQDLTGLSLWYRGSGNTVTELIDLDGVFIYPYQFAIFGHFAVPATVTAEFTNALNNTKGEVYVAATTDSTEIIDQVAWGDVSQDDGYHYSEEPAQSPPEGNSLQRCFDGNLVRLANPRNTNKEFMLYDNDLPTPFFGIACVTTDLPGDVIDCSGVIINEIGANISDQFIELYNPSNEAVQLGGCLLQTNRSSMVFEITLTELAPGGYLSIAIHDTELTLTKTTTGTVYLLTSDGQTEIDTQEYSNLNEDTSWAYFSEGWAQTYALTPGEKNVLQEYPSCDEGYYRNKETGRCNKVSINDSLVPCQPNQYRSLETNRCRLFGSTSTLTPCKEGQYRNPETNRCRKIASTSSLKPCDEDQYRNPETNRCRKKESISVPEADYAVKGVDDGPEAFTGWWALGGVGVLAAGYAGWEWRREITRFGQRFFRLFKK